MLKKSENWPESLRRNLKTGMRMRRNLKTGMRRIQTRDMELLGSFNHHANMLFVISSFIYK
jgi:hypothetical protein